MNTKQQLQGVLIVIGTSFLSHLIEKTDETCEIHGEIKRKIKGKEMEPVCPICQREKIDNRERELVESELDKSKKFRTQGWLKRLSLVADYTLQEASFETSKVAETGEQRKNFKQGFQIAKDYIAGETYNTLLVGKAGAGKSHLAMSILKDVNNNAKPYKRCLFLSIDELMREIRASYDYPASDWTERKAIDRAVKADVLVLDDLGAEIGLLSNQSQSSNFVGRVLTSILNGRTNKPTIITSNLKYSDIEHKYDKRITSRLRIGEHTIQFVETDDQRGKQF